MQIPFVYIYIFSLFKTFHRERERERERAQRHTQPSLFNSVLWTGPDKPEPEYFWIPGRTWKMFGGLCPCPCFGNHRSSDNDKDGPDLDPVLLVSGMGGSILHSKKKKFGFETRVWVRILLADLEFRKKLWSLYNPTTGLSLSLYKWINVYVVVCMCNKCVYVYIFYVCISGFACKLTWWLTCVFWFFFFGGVVFGWWESGGK